METELLKYRVPSAEDLLAGSLLLDFYCELFRKKLTSECLVCKYKLDGVVICPICDGLLVVHWNHHGNPPSQIKLDLFEKARLKAEQLISSGNMIEAYLTKYEFIFEPEKPLLPHFHFHIRFNEPVAFVVQGKAMS